MPYAAPARAAFVSAMYAEAKRPKSTAARTTVTSRGRMMASSAAAAPRRPPLGRPVRRPFRMVHPLLRTRSLSRAVAGQPHHEACCQNAHGARDHRVAEEGQLELQKAHRHGQDCQEYDE